MIGRDDKMPMIPPHKVLSSVQILAEAKDYNHALMNVPAMWKDTQGQGIKIAVLDTGVPDHVDITPCGGESMIPDYHEDKNGHSTHCAGIIAAIAGNNMGVMGIAPQVEDYYGAVLDGDGSGSIGSIIDGIHWAVDDIGVNVISMSLGIAAGVERALELEAACNYAVEQGVAVFAAAGNEYGAVGQPAIYDSVIAVAAVDSRKRHAEFSNTGPEVDFAAGGVKVYSTYLNNSYAKLSGTSMACPALAAVGALILAKHRAKDEILTPQQLRDHLRKIAYDVGPDGFDETFGHGIPVFGKREGSEPVEQPVEDANKAWWRIWVAMAGLMGDALDKDATLTDAVEAGLKQVAATNKTLGLK